MKMFHKAYRTFVLSGALCLFNAAGVCAVGPENPDFSVTDPTNPDFAWTLTGGENEVQAGSVTLREDGFVYPALTQDFTMPAGQDYFEFVLEALDLRPNQVGAIPDTLQVRLVLDGVAHVLSVQQDGRLDYDPIFVVPRAGASGEHWTPELPTSIRADLSSLTTDVSATLHYMLLASDAADQSSLRIGAHRLGRLEEGDPFKLWRIAQFGQAVLDDPALEATVWGDLADPDGDGLENRLEYFANLSPLTANFEPVLSLLRRDGAFYLRYRQSTEAGMNFTARVQTTTDLGGTWQDLNTAAAVVASGAGYELWELPVSQDQTQRFFRLAPWRQDTSSPIHLWRVARFGASAVDDPAQEASLWGDLADPDRDGLENRLEYFANLSPTTAEGIPVLQLVRRDGAFYLRYRQSAEAGMPYRARIQSTSDLGSPWQDMDPAANLIETQSTHQIWEVPLASGTHTRQFFRLAPSLD